MKQKVDEQDLREVIETKIKDHWGHSQSFRRDAHWEYEVGFRDAVRWLERKLSEPECSSDTSEWIDASLKLEKGSEDER
jgi:hypothetical protein